MRDDLLAVDDPTLEGPDYQDHCGGQDSYGKSVKLLATAGDDESIDSGLKEDSDVINALQSHGNDRSQSPYIIPAPAALATPAATAPQESAPAIDSLSATLALTTLMKSALDDPGRPPQVAMADNEQEWEICDIVGKEDVNGVSRWCPNLNREGEGFSC